MYLNTEFFLVSIQSECGRYGPEQTPYLDTFHAVRILNVLCTFNLRPASKRLAEIKCKYKESKICEDNPGRG